MDGNVAREGSRDAAGQEAVALPKPLASAVPESPLSSEIQPSQTTELIGVGLLLIILVYAVLILFRRTPIRCLRFAAFACTLPLLSAVGIAHEIAQGAAVMATNPQVVFADFSGYLYVAISGYWWMLAVSVVTIPLGIYWTVSAYANEILSRCSVQDEERDTSSDATAKPEGRAR